MCANAVRNFESLGCIVEEAIPDFDLEAVWQAAIRLRGWQQGALLLGYYNDPQKRLLLKPEAIFEVETGPVGLRHHGGVGGAHPVVRGGT
jgi:amidase